ncbi:MAG: hypothetical protein ABDI20_07570 [Candidatus Bipolaricaulaceae bacterium]
MPCSTGRGPPPAKRSGRASPTYLDPPSASRVARKGAALRDRVWVVGQGGVALAS